MNFKTKAPARREEATLQPNIHIFISTLKPKPIPTRAPTLCQRWCPRRAVAGAEPVAHARHSPSPDAAPNNFLDALTYAADALAHARALVRAASSADVAALGAALAGGRRENRGHFCWGRARLRRGHAARDFRRPLREHRRWFGREHAGGHWGRLGQRHPRVYARAFAVPRWDAA
jgi:hypothetical protein